MPLTPPPPLPTQPTRSPGPPGPPASCGADRGLPVFGLGAFGVLDDEVWVPLHGELDLATAPELLAGLALLSSPPDQRAADVPLATRRGTVRLEMSAVTFVDTSGLRALDDACTMLVQAGWRVCLTRPRPVLLRVLDLAISAGWFPSDVACADVEMSGQGTATRLTLSPWPPVPVAAGPGVDHEPPRPGTGAGSS